MAGLASNLGDPLGDSARPTAMSVGSLDQPEYTAESQPDPLVSTCDWL